MTTQGSGSIVLPDAPGIGGLSFRTYAGEDDIGAMVELKQSVHQEFGLPEIPSVEQERNELRNTTHIDPRADVVLAHVADQLVAMSSIEWSDTTEGQRHYHSLGWVHREWRRRGLGTAMLARNEARLMAIAATHEHRVPPALITWLEDADVGGLALARARGYEQVRFYRHMVRPDLDDIEIARLPDGIEVRAVTADELPRVWEALMEAFRDHFGAHDDSPAAYRRFAEDPGIDLDLWVVAFEGDEAVAGVLGYVEPEENRLFGYRRGWADPVFTRRGWRRRGIAHALLGRCLVKLREHGMTSAQLGVDTQNANDALTLYRRHRFEVGLGSSEWHRTLSV